MCIKFCGAFELALRGHEESKPSDSDNPGVYIGLINFAAELDAILAGHLKEASVQKHVENNSTIQNELLDAMLAVYRTEVINEIKSANFLAVEADETTDTSNQQQMVIIFRYVVRGQICERFWSFVRPSGHTAEELANVLLTELQQVLSSESDTSKLIGQSYDGAAVMSGKNNGVQAVIRRTYPYAYYIHCYAHQFNLTLEQAAQCHTKIRIFFANLQSFSTFFSRSSKRTLVLDEVVKKRIPRAVPTRWNFKSRTVINTLFEYKNSLVECLEKIRDDPRTDAKTTNEACGLLGHLESPEFLYWLKIIHFIMPHVEILFNQAQVRGLESLQLQRGVEQFEQQIMRIRSSIDYIREDEREPAKKVKKL